MENIIIVEGNEKYCFQNEEEVIKQFLGQDFYKLTEEEKYKRIRLRTVMNASIKNTPIKDLKKGEKIENIGEEQYIINNEETYILSLIKNNDIVMYEREKANIFVKDTYKNIEKRKLEKIENEYIIVNYCVNELIENETKRDGQ